MATITKTVCDACNKAIKPNADVVTLETGIMHEACAKEKAAQVLDDKLEQLDDRYTLVYVDYRDDLSGQPEVLAALLSDPEEGIQTFYDKNDDWIYDTRGMAATEIAQQLCEPWEWELLQVFQDDIELITRIEERDDSDPLKDLLRNTGNVWLTYDLNVDVGDMYAEETTAQKAREIAKALGVTYKHDKDALHELVVNASYGGSLKLLWSGGVDDLLDAKDGDTLIFDKANVAIIDYWNGSGHNVELTQPVRLKLERARLDLDDTHNYSYANKVCGLYAPAFYDNAPNVKAARKAA